MDIEAIRKHLQQIARYQSSTDKHISSIKKLLGDNEPAKKLLTQRQSEALKIALRIREQYQELCISTKNDYLTIVLELAEKWKLSDSSIESYLLAKPKCLKDEKPLGRPNKIRREQQGI